MIAWQPTASLEALKLRARVLAKIRAFFAERGVLEVETPLLRSAPVTDPYIDTFAVSTSEGMRYLQTSPEYAMKCLLCAGSGSIYQLTKAFRQEDVGRQHLNEFTMLEWYRVGFNDQMLMKEVTELLSEILTCPPAHWITYQALFEDHFNLNPHTADTSELRALCQKYVGPVQGLPVPDRDNCLQLLMSTVIEPCFDTTRPTIVYDFPASQAALAQLKQVGGCEVAARFEVYYGAIELGNAYFELTDANEQAKRFENDLAQRKALQKSQVPVDEKLLAALQHGLPSCAGIAMGLDRILMLAGGYTSIQAVVALV